MSHIKNQIDKLFYVSPRDMRKNRADAVHIMYSCAAFSNNGINVELITPNIKRNDYALGNNDSFSLYDVPNNFKITELNTRIKEVDNRSSGISVGFNKFIFHFFYILRHLSIFRNKKVIVYSKCYISTIPYILIKWMGLIRCKLVFETPFLKNNGYHKFIIKRMNAVVTMTDYVCDFLVNTFNIPSEDVVKSPVRFQTDYQNFSQIDKETCRTSLNWTKDTKYVVYAGKTGAKLDRIKVFAEASNAFKNTKFVIVGANKELQHEYSDNRYENLVLYPFQSYPEYLKFVNAADVLVATYEDTLYNRYTLSPGKGGAYLQSGNPVVFTDLPCLRERFPNNLVSFVKVKDVNDLVLKVKTILKDYDIYREKAEGAAKYASQRTFTDASRFILDKLNIRLFS